MPFDDETFSFIICTAAFKNFDDPVGALKEIYRVLKPNEKALIIDLRRDASRTLLDEYVKNMGLGSINSFITRWTFKLMLLKRAYTKDELKQFLSMTPFKEYDILEKKIGL